jgi:hypothetical protein
MHDRYKNLTSVLMWLGAAQDDNDLAMAAVDEVKDHLPDATFDNDKEFLDFILHLKTKTEKVFDMAMIRPLALMFQGNKT